MEVPAFDGTKLALSSVTLASVLERATGADSTIKRPFIWGSFRVVPRVERSFPRQEPLRLYYQIYDAAPDPESALRKAYLKELAFLKDTLTRELS